MTEAQKKQLVAESERTFRASLEQAAERLFAENERPIITVSGPTCSGKTTVSTWLSNTLTEKGFCSVLLSFDDFYKDRRVENRITDTVPDYESADCLDLAYLETVISHLRRRETVQIPIFDFQLGKRTGYREYRPGERDIYVFEGIQALYREITPMFGAQTRNLYIHVEPPASLEIPGEALRLARRLVRDVRTRDAAPSFTLFLWENVRRNEELNVFPHKNQAHILLNTYMAYEPYCLASLALPLLDRVTEEPYRQMAQTLAEFLSPYADTEIPVQMIPSDSVFREFIGV